MSNLSTLPKGDSAWLLRKAIERIIDQVSVLETNIGVSTSGNSANTQIIFNDDGTLRGDAGLVYNKTTDALTIAGLVTAGSATITGDLTVRTNKLAVTSTGVGIGTASPTAALDVFGFFGTSTAAAVLRNNSAPNNSNIVETQYFASNNNSGLDCIAKFGALNPIATGNNYGQFYWQIANAGSPTTAMTLNSTGLGVGYTPSGSADKLGSAATLGVVATGATADLNFRNSSLTAIQRIRYTDGTGVLTIGSATGTAYPVELGGSTSARSMTLDSSGNVGIGVTPSAGKGALQLSSGISFPATQVASSDANTLDDYEEGTWTGTLKGSVSDPTTPVTVAGKYTKIGRLVQVSINFSAVITTGASGNLSITGLPFASANDGVGCIGSVGFFSAATFTGYANSTILPNSSIIDFFWSQSNGVNGNVTHNAGTNRYINATLVYYV